MRRLGAALLLLGLAVGGAGCAVWPLNRLAPVMLADADRLADDGDYDAAAVAYDRFLAEHPNHIAVPHALARRKTVSTIIAMREETARLRDEVERLREEVGRARDDLTRSRDEAGRARDEAGRARDELGRARDDLGRSREDIARRDGDLQRLRQELNARQADLERLKEIDLKLERSRR
jgi:chromosome segregation ATPase